MFSFASVFRDVAYSRQRGEDPWLARHVLSAAIMLADESLADRLADAPEPFWQHVREALLAHREEACWESVEDAEAMTETAI
jgi:hypothetical protein